MKVVLVHGFLDTGRIMESMARHLDGDGHHCLVPSLRPNDGRDGLPAMARQLQDFLEGELEEGERFALVGFSMGTLISRYYLQELDGHRRVEAFFSISGPHDGTWTAYLYPGEGVRQMRPGSSFLRSLDNSSHPLESLPVTCYWTPFDLMIIPADSCRWSRGEEVRIPSLVHRWMVSDRRLLQDLSERLRRNLDPAS
jgi:triacylglycerol lipase